MNFDEINELCIKLALNHELRGQVSCIRYCRDGGLEVWSPINGTIYVKAWDAFEAVACFSRIESGETPLSNVTIVLETDAEISRQKFEDRAVTSKWIYGHLETMYGNR